MRQKPLICPLHLRQFIRLRKILMENLGSSNRKCHRKKPDLGRAFFSVSGISCGVDRWECLICGGRNRGS